MVEKAVSTCEIVVRRGISIHGWFLKLVVSEMKIAMSELWFCIFSFFYIFK